MPCTQSWLWRVAVALTALGLGALPIEAEQAQRGAPGAWQAETNTSGQPSTPGPMPSPGQNAVLNTAGSGASTATPLPPNTTIVPRSRQDSKGDVAAARSGQVSLIALLTQEGQNIDQGLVWRVFRDKLGPDKKAQLVSTHREASPVLLLDPGDYFVNVAFGRAHLTKKITVTSGHAAQESFVLNAGGLRVTPVLANGDTISDRSVVTDIFSDERDQYGQRTKVMSGLAPGVVVRLNAGIYSLVSAYGDANAVARADVTVEAGKLTEATLMHAAAKATFKLVARSGGDAVTDAQWSVANAQGETVKESAGAVPTHILAPGTYSVSARHAGQVYQRQFTVRAGDFVQVEVLMR
jgi:hypothetical protein